MGFRLYPSPSADPGGVLCAIPQSVTKPWTPPTGPGILLPHT